MVVLGSGGHTAEMLTLLRSMDCHARYTPRLYVIASTDGHSKTKMSQFEESLMQQRHKASSSSSASSSLGYATYLVPRSREVGQSYLSSVWTTAYAFVYSVAIVLRTMPDLILCNGPGTCVPICVAAYIPKFFGWKHITLVYVESLCRVKSLSLSGRLLAPLVDHFFVQWPQLLPRSPAGTLYLGRLC
ncbi:UDP-N-acetylglucosamine transferase subunit [Balamuthia mandrillaris]